ncbi:MAG: AAA family ATPase, partial [Kiritimatiellae bacterium]|nr:AAA family ATPase [Kiritimatiellia bacterium]
EQLDKLVKSLCDEAEVEYRNDGDISGRFDDFLKAAAAKSPTQDIVVLIDEYDEPVAKFIDDLDTLKKVRSDLHDFYEKLKVNSGSIRFLLMTGVTKLTKRYFLLFMKLIGADISGERQSARGRADAVLQDASGIYVFEFKYGKTAREALEQARTKEYAGPWMDAAAPVFYVGVNYDPERRGIDDPLVEASPTCR